MSQRSFVNPIPITEIRRDVEIDSPSIRLYFWSRNRPLLALVVLAMLALAALMASALDRKRSPVKAELSPGDALNLALRQNNPSRHAIVASLLRFPTPPSEEIQSDIVRLAPKMKDLATAICTTLRAGCDEPNAHLLILAHQLPPVKGANEAVADLLARHGQWARACDYYQREIQIEPHDGTRAKLVHLLAQSGDFATLLPLSADPAYASFLAPEPRMKLAFFQRDWRLAFERLMEMEFKSLHLLPVLMALAAGSAWLLIALHAAQPHQWLSFRTVAPIVATLLGAIGAFGSHFLAAWQEEVVGLRETGLFVSDLGYYIGVVAPRETIVKLLLTIPFIPRLLARRSPLDTLAVTGSIGLGFAIESNLQLCKNYELAAALPRLLTANFLHFAASALLGLAVCRCFSGRKGTIVPAALTFLAVVVTQGVYDAFTRVASVQAASAVGIAAFLILSRALFAQLYRWRDSFTDQFFLGATLVLALGAFAAALLVAGTLQIGFEQTKWALLRHSPILLLVVMVFYSQFKRNFAAIGSDLAHSG
jgi:hypothetical protein